MRTSILNFETYQLAFRRLVNLVPRRGRVIIWGDAEDSGPALRRAAEKAFLPGGNLRVRRPE